MIPADSPWLSTRVVSTATRLVNAVRMWCLSPMRVMTARAGQSRPEERPSPCKLDPSRGVSSRMSDGSIHSQAYRRHGPRADGRTQGLPLTAKPRRRALPVRDLEAMLTENAVEGAVFETYAAALALYQSTHAKTRAARDLFAEIAQDELDHAALAHAISSELLPRIDPAARLRVREAQQRALDRLAAAPSTELSPVEAQMGHPPHAFRRAFASQLRAEVAAA